MSSTSSGSSTLNSEQVYSQWVVAAIEVIAQSRLPNEMMNCNKSIPISSPFGLTIFELFGARKFLERINRLFNPSREHISLHVEVRSSDCHLLEKWVFAFDKDVVPTARSERKDQSLVKRLSIALRTLMSITRLYSLELEGIIVDIVEGPAEQQIGSPASDTRSSFSSGISSGNGLSLDVCSIASSFGMLGLTYTGARRDDFSAGENISLEYCPTPPRAMTFAPVLHESFMSTRKNVEKTLVIEMKQEPIDDLGYLSSPSRSASEMDERQNNFSSSSGNEPALVPPSLEDWISNVPILERQTTVARKKYSALKFFEQPVPLVEVKRELDRLRKKWGR